jgi:antitoxin component of MazEF toxin-antitoxin module
VLYQKLRKVGNSYVVTVPRDEVEQLGLQEGQLVAVEVRRVRVVPELPPRVAAAVEATIRENIEGLRYLAEFDRREHGESPQDKP